MKKWIFSALLVLTVSPALAEQTASSDVTSSFVREHAIALLNGILSPEQITTLNLLAHQVAIADACKGFEVDKKKFVDQFQQLTLQGDEKASAEQKDRHEKHLSVVYGMLVGGELATIVKDEAVACEQAGKEKLDPEFSKTTVWK
ncbi:hypothetical protein ACLBWS_09790 [Brucellaceae bacterium D45D]